MAAATAGGGEAGAKPGARCTKGPPPRSRARPGPETYFLNNATFGVRNFYSNSLRAQLPSTILSDPLMVRQTDDEKTVVQRRKKWMIGMEAA